MFEIPVADAPVDVRLVDPQTRREAGHWSFRRAGTLSIDFLAGAEGMCRIDGEAAHSAQLRDGFVSWPRMTFTVNGAVHELVSRDPEVLRRHYSRPQHQEEAYTPGKPDPYVEAFHQARLAQLRRLLHGVHGRVLDAGSGYSLVVMAGPFPGLQVVACDRDPGAVRMLIDQRRALAVVASTEALPYRQGRFDAVFAGEIVEHLLDPDAALREWVQALRPGGRLVVTTPNREHIMARLLDRREVKNPEHLFEYSPQEFRAAVERAGARVDHIEGIDLALPVYIPAMGWRNVLAGVRRRWGLPAPVVKAALYAGRWFPGAAENLAIVATRRS